MDAQSLLRFTSRGRRQRDRTGAVDSARAIKRRFLLSLTIMRRRCTLYWQGFSWRELSCSIGLWRASMSQRTSQSIAIWGN